MCETRLLIEELKLSWVPEFPGGWKTTEQFITQAVMRTHCHNLISNSDMAKEDIKKE